MIHRDHETAIIHQNLIYIIGTYIIIANFIRYSKTLSRVVPIFRLALASRMCIMGFLLSFFFWSRARKTTINNLVEQVLWSFVFCVFFFFLIFVRWYDMCGRGK